MCHLCMKRSKKFDPNQMYTFDKILVKHISVNETLLKLDLEPKGQQSKGTKIFHLLTRRHISRCG